MEPCDVWKGDIKRGILRCPATECQERFFMAHAFLTHISACCISKACNADYIADGLPCPLCPASISLKMYTRHIRSNHKDPFADLRMLQKGTSVTCPNYSCNLVFHDGAEYLQHAVICRPCYICRVCEQTYKSSRNLHCHTCLGRRVKASSPDQGAKRRRKQNVPLKDAHADDSREVAPMTPKEILNIEEDLEKWKLDVRRGILNCPNDTCGERFYLPHAFVSHFDTCNHNEPHVSAVLEGGTLPCSFCPGDVPFKVYSRHVRANHKDSFADLRMLQQGSSVTCPNYSCHQVFHTGIEYLEHAVTCRPCFICKVCHQTYKSSRNLQCHTCLGHPVKEIGAKLNEPEAPCSNRGKSSKRKQKAPLRMESANGSDEDTPTDPKSVNIEEDLEKWKLDVRRGVLNCPNGMCRERFYLPHPFVSHFSVCDHTEPHIKGLLVAGTIPCSFCPADLPFKAYSRHIRTNHTDSFADMRELLQGGTVDCRNYLCKMKFTSGFDYVQHASGCKPRYHCDICLQTYKKSKTILNHVCSPKKIKLEATDSQCSSSRDDEDSQATLDDSDLSMVPIRRSSQSSGANTEEDNMDSTTAEVPACDDTLQSTVHDANRHVCDDTLPSTVDDANASDDIVSTSMQAVVSEDLPEEGTKSTDVAARLDRWHKNFLNGELVCPSRNCGEAFSVPGHMYAHIASKCADEDDDGIREAVLKQNPTCFVCKSVFTSIREFNKHFRPKHFELAEMLMEIFKHGSVNCRNHTCGVLLSTVPEAMEHQARCGVLVLCDVCRKCFKSLPGHKNHTCKVKIAAAVEEVLLSHGIDQDDNANGTEASRKDDAFKLTSPISSLCRRSSRRRSASTASDDAAACNNKAVGRVVRSLAKTSNDDNVDIVLSNDDINAVNGIDDRTDTTGAEGDQKAVTTASDHRHSGKKDCHRPPVCEDVATGARDARIKQWQENCSNGVLVCPCENCSESFILPGHLFSHMAKKCLSKDPIKDVALREKQTCMACKEVFESISEFNKHFLAKHIELITRLRLLVKNGTSTCENHNCKAVLSTVRESLDHLARCGVLVLCNTCQKEYKSVLGHKHHVCRLKKGPPVLKYNKNPLAVPETDEIDKETLNDLVAKWNEQFVKWKFVCPNRECGVAFHSPSRLLSHMYYLCPKPSSVGVAILKNHVACCRCRKTFIAVADHNRHFRAFHLLLFLYLDELTAKNETQCMNQNCNVILKTAEECNQHDLACKYLQSCLKCGKQYKALQGFKQHMCKSEVEPACEEGDANDEDLTKPRRAKRKAVSVIKVITDDGDDGGRDDDEEAYVESEPDSDAAGDDFVKYDVPIKKRRSQTKTTPINKEKGKSENKERADVTGSDAFESFMRNILKRRKRIQLHRGHQLFQRSDTRMEKVMEWYAANSSQMSFPQFSVNPQKVTHLSHGEASLYLPTNPISPAVKIDYLTKSKSRNRSEFVELKLFDAAPSLEGSSAAMFNAGGPIHAMEWCPDAGDDEEFIALSANLTYSQIHEPVCCENATGLIQLWASSKNHWRFGYGIAHDWGPVYSFKWCPSGGRVNCPETGNRIGCLALACGDGLVRILSLPHPDSIASTCSVQIVRLTNDLLLAPRASFIADRSSHLTKVWCVDWDRSKGNKYIAAGYADGFVAVFKIDSISPLLRGKNNDVLPVKNFQAHAACVTDLSFNPSNPHLLATVSFDKYVRVFDVRAPEVPIYEYRRAALRSVEWPILLCGLFVSDDESFNTIPASARFIDFVVSLSRLQTSIYVNSHITTSHNSSVMDASFNDWLNVVISCCSGGQVAMRVFSENVLRHALPLYRVSAIENEMPATPKPALDRTHLVDVDKTIKLRETYFETTREIVSSIGDDRYDYRYVYRDCNYPEFATTMGPMAADVQRSRIFSTMPSTPTDLSAPLSINVISWNPSFKSRTLLASGGNLGLVRIHNLASWA